MIAASDSLVDNVIATLNSASFEQAISILGVYEKDLPSGAKRYTSSQPGVKSFVVHNSGQARDVCFLLDNRKVALKYIERDFGKFSINYNFRENYTRIQAKVNLGCVSEIYFVNDNKLEPCDKGFTEKNPFGRQKQVDELSFESFCLVVDK